MNKLCILCLRPLYYYRQLTKSPRNILNILYNKILVATPPQKAFTRFTPDQPCSTYLSLTLPTHDQEQCKIMFDHDQSLTENTRIESIIDKEFENSIDKEVEKNNTQNDLESEEIETINNDGYYSMEKPISQKGTKSNNDSHANSGSSISAEVVGICNLLRNARIRWNNETEKSMRQYRSKLKEGLVIEVLRALNDPQLCIRFFLWAGRQVGYTHTTLAYEVLLHVAELDKLCNVPESLLLQIQDEDDGVLAKMLDILTKKCAYDGQWDEAFEGLQKLKDFGYKPTCPTYIAIIQVLSAANQSHLAVQVFDEMSELGHQVDSYTLGVFTRCLCRAGGWEEALDIANRSGVDLDAVIYTKMISGLCDASMVQEALIVLRRMRTSSCLPNDITYRILLTALVKADKLDMCGRILQQTVLEGFSPGYPIFHSIVSAFCKAGRVEDVQKVIRLMVRSQCPPNQVTYNVLIGRLCQNMSTEEKESLDSLMEVYDAMVDAGFVLNNANLGLMCKWLCSAGVYDQAFRVMREMLKKGLAPNTGTCSKVFLVLCKANKVDKVMMIFKQMKASGHVPSVYNYTILISYFCKSGLLEQALEWFNEMKEEKCYPSVVTYNVLIHAFLKSGRISEADKLLQEMSARECRPSVVTFTVLIDGYCKAGYVDTACKIYDHIMGKENFPPLELYFKNMKSAGIKPSIQTYGALIDGLCKSKRVEDAYELWISMIDAGCEPDIITYNSLIDGLCKSNNLKEAQNVFLKMVEEGRVPDMYTYNFLIDALFKLGRLDLAERILLEMIDKGCSPNLITYTEMIDGLCKAGKTNKAFKLFSSLTHKGCPPDVVAYTAMIDGFGRERKLGQALKLLEEMKMKACAPNAITYEVLIRHCCIKGMFSKACELLEEMKNTCWPVDRKQHTDIISGVSQAFSTSHELLQQVSSSTGVSPVVASYVILLDSLNKAGQLESALALQKEIMSLSSKLDTSDVSSYAMLIEALCKFGNVAKAFEVYSEVTCKGCVFDLSTLSKLMKGLCLSGKRDEAFDLLHRIHQMSYSDTSVG